MKLAISEKENDIVAERNSYFRLIEGYKVQQREKNKIVEKLTAEDAEKMKLML